MATISLPYNLNLRPYQQAVWDFFVVQGGTRGLSIWPRRNGKDLIDLNITVAKSMQRVGLHLYVAPFYAQIRNIIWEGADDSGRRFLDYIPKELIKKKYESRMALEMVNGSILRFGGADNPDSLVGGNPIGINFTEYSLHKSDAWHYLRPILTNNGGWAKFNGTPRGLNHMFTMAEMARENPDWFFQHLTCLDTGYPTLEMIDAERKAGMPESLIQQEYYCSFMASAESVLIPLDIIQPCLDTQLTAEDYQFEPRLVGVDPAYSAKGDQAVIAKRQGRLLHPLQKFRGVDNMKLADHIVQIIKEWSPHGVLIDSGRGEGVISRLERLGYGDLVIPVVFNSTPYNPQLYANKRVEIYCKMRDWFLKGVQNGAPPSIPRDQNLITGLSTPMMDLNDKGLITLESKKQIRSRGAYVMDEPDAVAVTFAEDIAGDGATGNPRYNAMREELDLYQDIEDDISGGYDAMNYFNKRMPFYDE